MSFTFCALHKLRRHNASQALRARCVVSDGELVVGYSSLVVGRMVVIAIVVASVAHRKFFIF